MFNLILHVMYNVKSILFTIVLYNVYTVKTTTTWRWLNGKQRGDYYPHGERF